METELDVRVVLEKGIPYETIQKQRTAGWKIKSS